MIRYILDQTTCQLQITQNSPQSQFLSLFTSPTAAPDPPMGDLTKPSSTNEGNEAKARCKLLSIFLKAYLTGVHMVHPAGWFKSLNKKSIKFIFKIG